MYHGGEICLGGIFMSFREMRRFRQQLSREECEAILAESSSGVLAVTGDGNWPYAVPLSYAYRDGKLLFHCAVEGHKLDALRREPRASFCVIQKDQVIPDKFTTYYRSVIAFGTVHILEPSQDLEPAARALTDKYCPQETPQAVEKEIAGALHRMCILEMTVAHMTGKQARELVQEHRS